MSFGSFSLRELTCVHCVYLSLWTRKVLCGSFYAPYIVSFIHSVFRMSPAVQLALPCTWTGAPRTYSYSYCHRLMSFFFLKGSPPPHLHPCYSNCASDIDRCLFLITNRSEVLHCRSLPTYLKLMYRLNHSSSLIHPYISLKTMEWRTKLVGLNWDFGVIELMECTHSVYFCICL